MNAAPRASLRIVDIFECAGFERDVLILGPNEGLESRLLSCSPFRTMRARGAFQRL